MMIRDDDDDVEYVPVPMTRDLRAWLVEVANGCHQNPAVVAAAVLRDVMADDVVEHGHADEPPTQALN